MSLTIRRRQASTELPLIERLLQARQPIPDADTRLLLKDLHPPALLKNMDAAVTLLRRHLAQQNHVLIVSDFDADGATSCALGMRALRSMGFQQVSYIVPNRFEYGYGLTPEIVALAASYSPDLLITVDNGISSIEGVAAANAAGMEVLVTDHHLPGRELPAAAAIVNPNQPGCDFPSKSLAGVGVIFYVMLALRAALRQEGWFEQNSLPEPRLSDLLDLVALGTVADVVPLDRNNRILVRAGLERLRKGQGCPGILALLRAGKRQLEQLSAADLAFAVAPRLNAAGRLDDMGLGIECLLSESQTNAEFLVSELDRINEARKQIESSMRDQAMQILAGMRPGTENLPAGLCLYEAEWHQGVIGILAARVKEMVHRPVIAFADAGESGQLKGSARSIPGIHIRDVIDAVATAHPGLVSKFGGHAMAAGLSLEQEDLADFRGAFAHEVASRCSPETLQQVIVTDGELPGQEFTVQTAELIRAHGPWGQGYPEPVFDGRFKVVGRRVLQGRHLKLVVHPLSENAGSCEELDAIAFNLDQQRLQELNTADELQLVYRLDINHFQGRKSLQLMIEHIIGDGQQG
ncbi:MAG: single-stranded-DNA-specific exonuclease RecJ [Pseudomonadales bacterium]|nr:single-stranded-DNA-specific exonuclease RecJ [Pseudomonadales bacterium]